MVNQASIPYGIPFINIKAIALLDWWGKPLVKLSSLMQFSPNFAKTICQKALEVKVSWQQPDCIFNCMEARLGSLHAQESKSYNERGSFPWGDLACVCIDSKKAFFFFFERQGNLGLSKCTFIFEQKSICFVILHVKLAGKGELLQVLARSFLSLRNSRLQPRAA